MVKKAVLWNVKNIIYIDIESKENSERKKENIRNVFTEYGNETIKNKNYNYYFTLF